MLNLLVDLDERHDSDVRARAARALDSLGYAVEIRHGADDRTLAWIDDVFGGTWSSEANLGSNVVVTREGAPVGFATIDPQGLRFAWLRGIAAQEDVGIFGPFGVEPSHRGGALGPSLLTIALCEMRARGFARAVIAAVGAGKLIAYYERHAGARVAERFDLRDFTPKPVRTVVMASGSGTNFQAVIDRVAAGLPLEITALVSNNSDAYAIERARAAGIAPIVLPWTRKEQSRAHYDELLRDAVAKQAPELVLLLGWMHLLDGAFVTSFPELINVHPAFLPLDSSRDRVGMPDGSEIAAFRGAYAIRDALEAGSAWVGASVHQVTLETDRGPILARKPLRVLPDEDASHVLERLHPIEHELVACGIRRWLHER